MIFQEPMTALNPTMKIGRQVGEGLKLHSDCSKEERRQKVLQALEGGRTSGSGKNIPAVPT